MSMPNLGWEVSKGLEQIRKGRTTISSDLSSYSSLSSTSGLLHSPLMNAPFKFLTSLINICKMRSVARIYSNELITHLATSSTLACSPRARSAFLFDLDSLIVGQVDIERICIKGINIEVQCGCWRDRSLDFDWTGQIPQ